MRVMSWCGNGSDVSVLASLTQRRGEFVITMDTPFFVRGIKGLMDAVHPRQEAIMGMSILHT
jgi:hypothetical protein